MREFKAGDEVVTTRDTRVPRTDFTIPAGVGGTVLDNDQKLGVRVDWKGWSLNGNHDWRVRPDDIDLKDQVPQATIKTLSPREKLLQSAAEYVAVLDEDDHAGSYYDRFSAQFSAALPTGAVETVARLLVCGQNQSRRYTGLAGRACKHTRVTLARMSTGVLR